ncbi:hypothetical protein Tco_0924804 [Tanacetum coccineum]|uniref:Uncharacterized protein n=1 Tax=Tanacetum coccineum TaxID=301880 RepID=A0ABQ5D501_9ASTR
MEEKPVLKNKGRVTGQREIRPVWNKAQRVNHQNKLTHPHPKRKFVPTSVLTKSGQVSVNVVKQNSPRATTLISTDRPVNIVAPKSKVNDGLPITYSYFKVHLPVKRAFNQKSATKTNNLNEKVKTVRVNNVTTVGSKAVVGDEAVYKELDDKMEMAATTASSLEALQDNVPVESHNTPTATPSTLPPHILPTLRSPIRQETEVPQDRAVRLNGDNVG